VDFMLLSPIRTHNYERVVDSIPPRRARLFTHHLHLSRKNATHMPRETDWPDAP